MTQAPPAHRRLTISLSWKLLIAFSLVFSVIFAVAFAWFYRFSTQAALEQIRGDLANTLSATIEGIDGDEFAAFVSEAVVDPATGVPDQDTRYLSHQQWLDLIHRIEPRANPYTYVKSPEGSDVQWVGDIFRIIRPDEGTLFLESYTPQAEFILQGLDQETSRMTIYSDDWGSWVSAYGPIRDSQGQTVGAVGIDFAADYVGQVQQQIRNSVLQAILVTYGVLFVLIFILSRVLTRPIVKLTNMASCVAKGWYDQDFSGLVSTRGPRDEITSLAETFIVMVDKVREREESLKQQVAELKIEIDEVKRQQQVGEIVDSDFFQDLRDKAKTIRRRRSQGPTATEDDVALPVLE
jgi:HAMP domain-containing protein